MAPTFNILDQKEVQLLLAANSLSMLKRFATYITTGFTEWDPAQFERGQTITLTKAKRSSAAQDFDPYLGVDALEEQPGNMNVPLTLERLFTNGFPIFSHDSSRDRYVAMYSESNADSIARATEDYFYTRCFLDMSEVPTTGTFDYGGQPPLKIQWLEDGSGNLLPMTRSHLIRAEASFDDEDVPAGNRFSIMKPFSYSDLFENAPTDEGRAGSIAGGTDILANGLPFGSFINRYSFAVGKSNAIGSQADVADISAGGPTVAIASVVDDTTVFFDDAENVNTPVPLGAVLITTGAALTPAAIAVGDIIRIGATGSRATAYGRVLRIDPGLTDIHVVPYDDRARKLVAADITPGTDLVSAPEVGNINTAHHREFMAYAFRTLAPPSDGSGARMTMATDMINALVFQVLRGDYNVNQFKESARTAVLCGAKPSDYRKGLLYATA